MDRRDFLLGMTTAGALSPASASAQAEGSAPHGVPIIRTMAELRAPTSLDRLPSLATATTALVYLRGFAEPFDGGEGLFAWYPDATDADNGGTVISPRPNAKGRWRRVVSAGPLNIRWFGARGNGKVDDAPAIQAALDTGLPLYFPAGDYACRSSLTYTAARPVILIGAHTYARANHGLAVRIIDGRKSPGDEPLVRRREGWMRADGSFTDGRGGVPDFPGGDVIRLENMCLWGDRNNPDGQLMQLFNLRSCYFENCRFEQFCLRGLVLGEAVFDTSVINCAFRGHFFAQHDPTFRDPLVREKALRAWGLHTQGHCYIVGATAVGCGVGVDMGGSGASLYGARLEMNAYGLVLGQGRYTSKGGGVKEPYRLSRSAVTGVSFEANAIGVLISDVAGCVVTGVGGQGSPTGSVKKYEDEEGVRIENANWSSLFSGFVVGGQFTRGAIINFSRTPVQNLAVRNTLAHGVAVGGVSQVLLSPPGGGGGAFHLVGTELFPSAPQRRGRTLTSFHDLMLTGLTALNIRDVATAGEAAGGPVFAKNLGGAIKPAAGAKAAPVGFAAELTPAAFAMLGPGQGSGPRPGSSSLAAGDYWYATTVVAPHGETGINYDNDTAFGYWKYTVRAGEEVRLLFSGSLNGLKRRIYRGRRKGWFEGYWEQWDNAPFVDDGRRPFVGTGMPPRSFGVPSRIEDDANYHIVATPSWPTSVYVTAKATTGFTLNFTTPAPDDGQTVAWLLFRA